MLDVVLARPRRFFRKHEGIIQWICLLGMLLVTIHLVEDSRRQTESLRVVVQRLDARQDRLCVALRNGRVVFKKVLDQLGQPASQVSVVDCPVHTGPHHQ